MNLSHQLRAHPPALPSLSEESEAPEKSRRSWVNFSLAGLLLLQAFAAVVVFLLQIATALVIFLMLILAFVALHYLAWGRWLGEAIRQEVEDEEREAEFRARQGFG